MTIAERHVAEALERNWEDAGEDDANVSRGSKERSDAIREAAGLLMISIRLQKGLIEDLKFISMAHGIGYQPLIRDILSRFVVHEKKKIIAEAQDRVRQEIEAEKQKLQQMELELKRQKVA